MIKNTKLKPCPFCGSAEVQMSAVKVGEEFGRERDTGYMYEIECFNCGAKGPRKLYLEWAVERWNGRAETEEGA